MTNEILIFHDRCLIPERDTIGVVGEYNAEKLIFRKFHDINGDPIENYVMQVVIQAGGERYIDEPVNDEFPIDSRFTNTDSIILVVQFLKAGEVKWRSYPLTLNVIESLPDSKQHRTYLENFEIIINEDGELIIGHDGNFRFRRVGDNLEVNI